MYLVIGATGNIGGQLVTQLVEQGHEVRALVRDPSRATDLPSGVDVAVGDLDDAASLAAAAKGVEAAFFMQVGPDPRQATSMAEAAKAGGVRRIVLLSSIGTRLQPLPMIGARIAARDEVLHRSGLAVTTLRPNTLMSNAPWWIQSIRDEGRVFDATDPGRTSPVDPADVARVAAIALADERHAGHGYLACCRFRGHDDKIVTMGLEAADEAEVQPRVQARGGEAGGGARRGRGAGVP